MLVFLHLILCMMKRIGKEFNKNIEFRQRRISKLVLSVLYKQNMIIDPSQKYLMTYKRLNIHQYYHDILKN